MLGAETLRENLRKRKKEERKIVSSHQRERERKREQPPVRQSRSRSISIAQFLFLPRTRSPVALVGLMVGGGWKSIALNNEPQGSILSLSLSSWSLHGLEQSLMHPLSFGGQEEGKAGAARSLPLFSSLSSLPPSIFLRLPSPSSRPY